MYENSFLVIYESNIWVSEQIWSLELMNKTLSFLRNTVFPVQVKMSKNKF